MSFMLNNSDVAVHGGGPVRDVSFELPSRRSAVYTLEGNVPPLLSILIYTSHTNIARLPIA